MTQAKILVTAANGKTGRALVAQLREKNVPIKALVRRLDARSVQLQKLGAEVVVADMFDPDQLLDAMRDTQRAYFCPPMHPHMIQSASAFCLAARAAKLECVVGLSQWLASPNHPSLHTRQVWHADQMLAAIPNLAHVTLNPGYFADNYLRFLDFAALLGIWPIITGTSRNAPPSNEDIARCAAAILLNPDKHAGKIYRPTGTNLLSAYDMLPIIRRVLNSPVIPMRLPIWMLLRAARIQGEDAFVMGSLVHYLEDHKQGAFEMSAPNDDIVQLTGAPAEPFETTVRRYAAMGFAQKSVANRLRAFINFNRVPFSRGYNLKAFEENQFHPMAPKPEYAMQSAAWRISHGAGQNRAYSFSAPNSGATSNIMLA